MNSKFKSLTLMTAAMMMTATSNYPITGDKPIRKDMSHLRKKCKSCKLFPCDVKWKSNPMSQACEKYLKK